MTKEEIIATAIREAFLCGKEAGEESQRMWHSMQQKIEAAKNGGPDHDPHRYDGVFGMIPNYRVKIDPESALSPDSKEVTFQVQAVPGQRIGDTPEEQVAMLDHQCCVLKQENERLSDVMKEKDAIIAELSNELIAAEQQKPAIKWRSLEEKPEDGTWVVYLEETFSQLLFKGETRKYMGKTLSAPTVFRGGHVECVDPMQPHLLAWVPLTDFIPEGLLEDVTDKVQQQVND